VSGTVRLGGMALANGVLVHGPTAWGCAIRTDDGEIKVVAQRKRTFASGVSSPLLRGPARLAEAFALLPQIRRAMPEARLPFERPRVLGAMLGSVVAANAVRRSGLKAGSQELLSGLISLAPAMLALRGGEVASYHGAEHVTIGSYEHGEARPREHERCGTHLVGPLLLSTAAANVAVRRLPEAGQKAGRAAAAVGAVAASTEIFGWMTRNPDHVLARALARPGHEFQHRVATAEPTDEQLEVAEAALRACLELEAPEDVDADA
jgi:uncharacterized protein YqhQ